MTDTVPPTASAAWSSTLSVPEHRAITAAGFVPRGLVMGSSVVVLGRVYSPTEYLARGFSKSVRFPGWSRDYRTSELGGDTNRGGAGAAMFPAQCYERLAFEDGVELASRRAVGRLVRETQGLGAHGVVGTRLTFRYLEGLHRVIELTALGTAVVRPGAPPTGKPFTSHLDGQALLKLLQAGLVPVAVGVGVGSVKARVLHGVYRNRTTLVRPFGEAIEASRRIAAERLSARLGAGGATVLGTTVETSTSWEDSGQVADAVLTGTLVRRFAPARRDRLPLPIMRLSRP